MTIRASSELSFGRIALTACLARVASGGLTGLEFVKILDSGLDGDEAIWVEYEVQDLSPRLIVRRQRAVTHEPSDYAFEEGDSDAARFGAYVADVDICEAPGIVGIRAENSGAETYIWGDLPFAGAQGGRIDNET